MSKDTKNLNAFFNKKKPVGKKQKKEEEAVVVEEKKIEETLTQEFIDSDDETANLDLIAPAGRGGVKDVKEIEAAKQRKIDAENEK